MKKTIFGFIFAIAFALIGASCGNNATEATTETVDSINVVTVDSLAEDSATINTVAVDSTVVDSTVVKAE